MIRPVYQAKIVARHGMQYLPTEVLQKMQSADGFKLTLLVCLPNGLEIECDTIEEAQQLIMSLATDELRKRGPLPAAEESLTSV